MVRLCREGRALINGVGAAGGWVWDSVWLVERG